MSSNDVMNQIFAGKLGQKTTFCIKRKYKKRIEAVVTLLYLKNRFKGKREKQLYYCGECKAWHLSSKE